MVICVKDFQENVVPEDHCAGIRATTSISLLVQVVDRVLGQLIGIGLEKKWGVLLFVCAVVCITYTGKAASIVSTILDMLKTGHSGIERQKKVEKKWLSV